MFINELEIFHLIKSSDSSDSSTGLVNGLRHSCELHIISGREQVKMSCCSIHQSDSGVDIKDSSLSVGLDTF